MSAGLVRRKYPEDQDRDEDYKYPEEPHQEEQQPGFWDSIIQFFVQMFQSSFGGGSGAAADTRAAGANPSAGNGSGAPSAADKVAKLAEYYKTNPDIPEAVKVALLAGIQKNGAALEAAFGQDEKAANAVITQLRMEAAAAQYEGFVVALDQKIAEAKNKLTEELRKSGVTGEVYTAASRKIDEHCAALRTQELAKLFGENGITEKGEQLLTSNTAMRNRLAQIEGEVAGTMSSAVAAGTEHARQNSYTAYGAEGIKKVSMWGGLAGLASTAVGGLLCLTTVGAPIGAPMVAYGLGTMGVCGVAGGVGHLVKAGNNAYYGNTWMTVAETAGAALSAIPGLKSLGISTN